MTNTNDGTKIKFTLGQIFTFFGVALPLITLLIAGYVNIMTKLTELDTKLTTSTNNYKVVTTRLDIMDLQVQKLRIDLEKHMSSEK